ncbi:MAG: hypothetical protein KGJ23_07865 [Euryarchaeota archaeon]|nr:hypothetical protein [Euryarchaeota archaeon]MDE1836516.1 hypothetical protein [Euryarchaeota archaeon]MDE1879289.1 hypothetical protein [Euryarchaeota archaeon]MDE2044486.1 hypothetical protein [Thermoplasmata archaeon]
MPWTDDLAAKAIDERGDPWTKEACPKCGATQNRTIIRSAGRRLSDCLSCGANLVSEVVRYYRVV